MASLSDKGEELVDVQGRVEVAGEQETEEVGEHIPLHASHPLV
jgi:hypothetical protein